MGRITANPEVTKSNRGSLSAFGMTGWRGVRIGPFSNRAVDVAALHGWAATGAGAASPAR